MPDSFVKDPDEVVDYVRDWSADLGDDTIATSEWVPDDGIDVDSDDSDDTTATVWLSGGTVGNTYNVLNRITSVGGRVFDKTLRFAIRAK